MTIFPLQYPVLLWGINKRWFMNYSFFLKVWGKNLVEIVPSIIWPKPLDNDPKLIFDYGTEIWKCSTNVKLMFEQKNLGNTSTIINESFPRNIRNSRWTLNINVNKIKRNRTSFIANTTRKKTFSNSKFGCKKSYFSC